jgi:hypothetical protein
LLVVGGYVTLFRRMYYFAMGGLILIGIGSILFGLTNGFSDFTPRGLVLRKLGITAFIAGLPLIFYSLYKLF